MAGALREARLMSKTVLVIAGSDSSGGAGLVRDAQVLAEFDVIVRCVVTAVTAQTDVGVEAIHHVPPQVIRRQIHGALENGEIHAIKIGMLGTCAAVETVAELLPSRDHTAIVLDPVLRSSSGVSLMDEPGLTALRDLLLPRTTLLTPNLPEAARLLNEGVAICEDTAIGQAKRIRSLGAQAVLLKGGHASGEEAIDILITDADPYTRLRASRTNATLRGTGCSLSSAIAALLAQRVPLVTACERAKGYVLGQLENAAREAARATPDR